MKALLPPSSLNVNIVKSTSSSISRLLFNNSNRCKTPQPCTSKNCELCRNDIRSKLDHVTSSATGFSYPIDTSLSCTDGGIYIVKGACDSQYTGKSVHFSQRFIEHFHTRKPTAIYQHKKQCTNCVETNDFEVSLVESCHNRGKYSLSEREFLWNSRIKGTMNVQKTLKAN